jgi:hypothetical protein
MGIFSGANGAKFMGKRRKIKDYPGAHAIEVVAFTAGIAPGPGSKAFFALEMRVHASTNPALAELISKSGQPAVCSWATQINDYPDYFYSDIKSVLGVVLGKDPTEVTEADMEAASSEANPHAGTILACECFPKGKNDRKGNPIVETVFSPAPQAAA